MSYGLYSGTESPIFVAQLTTTAIIQIYCRIHFGRNIAVSNLNFKSYAQFGKAEIKERIQLLVQLVNLVWNTEMFA